MKLMTAKEAWAFLCSQWSKPILFDLKENGKTLCIRPMEPKFPTGYDESDPDQAPCFGLCQSIVRLHRNKAVDDRTFNRMEFQLRDFLEEAKWDRSYLYPLNKEGAAKRAHICEILAKAA